MPVSSHHGSLGRKYAIGKMAEIMVACNKMIFKLQEEVYEASKTAVSMGEIPAICTSSSTCFGPHLDSGSENTPVDRTTSLPTPPEPKTVRDPRLKEIYEKLMDLESVGRVEWLKVFMHMSSYLRVLRPLSRADWEDKKKFIHRHTLRVDGPHPGLSDNLITAGNKPLRKTRRPGKKPAVVSTPLSIKNVEFVGPNNDEDFFFNIDRSAVSGTLKKSNPKTFCDCLCTASTDLSSPSKNRTKRFAGKGNRRI
ncbi:uncharacterized protein LOC105688705 [Athalia rosae]|uniref:uncharacterized protein LOC105688705 n=1 Tax=Athalia rosae TaxID=37344 RepID=UPI002034545C|nr:uncharacterized protein LOC105688705 [Athalia rosae]XP_048513201.1 uncharacterized protein LOC105688705 [Athalia rosae]